MADPQTTSPSAAAPTNSGAPVIDTSTWDKAIESMARATGAISQEYKESAGRRDKMIGDAFQMQADKPPPAPPPVPAMTPPPQQQQRSPLQAFGSFASTLAIFGGLLTRRPLINSLNGAASAMNALRAVDAAGYQHAFDQWKTQSDYAFKTLAAQNERYNAITGNKKLSFGEMNALLGRELAANHDDSLFAMWRAGQTDKVITMLADRAKFTQQGQIELDRLKDLGQQHADELQMRRDALNEERRYHDLIAGRGSAAAQRTALVEDAAANVAKLKAGGTVNWGGWTFTPQDFKTLTTMGPLDITTSPSPKQRALGKMLDAATAAAPTGAAAPSQAATPSASPLPYQSAADVAAILQKARNAIAKGAPREAVIDRLKSAGVDPGSL